MSVRSIIRLGIRFVSVALLTTLLHQARADEPRSLSEGGRQERLKKIRAMVEPFNVTAITNQEAQLARILEEPSLLYADNTREVSDSSLWVWEISRRPIGVTAIESHRSPMGIELWTFEFAALSDQKLRLSLSGRQWLSDPSSIRSIEGAPAVAETRNLRTQQMKRLAERFAAIELHRSQGRTELRRLPTPVYRQAEASSGDGAIFVFAHGTNPEVALSIQTSAKIPVVWTYTLGALTAEELYVMLDGKEVWREVHFTMPGARPAYLNGRVPSIIE